MNLSIISTEIMVKCTNVLKLSKHPYLYLLLKTY